MSLFRRAPAGAEQLRQRLSREEVLVAPGCFDALSARVIERAGFEAAFLGGFAVAATRLGLPDTGLLSYGEMVDQGQDVCTAASIPIIGDADTGYGNEVNVRRTLAGFARAGFACVMIEDQCWPKRCGHTSGIETVDQEEAISRVQAAVEARDDLGLGVLVLARTDAAGTEGFDEALRRAEAFAKLGADLTFIEAPKSELEMRRYCEIVPGHKTANMVEDGKTPWLRPEELREIGYSLVLYPLTLVLTNLAAMERAARSLRNGSVLEERAQFQDLQRMAGFDDYWSLEARYGAPSRAATRRDG